ncbi:hypothetical protein INT48_008691 [Thamnidium elegans]|uniref:DUSP domain-containing protein n=1 Tax=Thamnidium elegans TaxID=101142 RepID=A0A8H7SIE1_9FUNG|nr:hypothetical protein INT48_008691 [Thamnidium elegans]
MEIIDKISSALNSKDILCFIQSSSALYYRAQHPSFWKHLCELNGINYCHPNVTWKELFCSGELSNMCPHLNTNMLDSSFIQSKKQLIWSHLKNNQIVCLDSSCDFFGEGAYDTDHYATDKHSIILKLSLLHMMELWCNHCVKTIGFDYFHSDTKQGSKSESYIMKKLTKKLGSVTQETDNQLITKRRQEVESDIFRIQFRNSTTHIIQKDWHTAWLDFISGKTIHHPGPLLNTKLSRQDGTLNPALFLGKDFELIGNLTCWYIERMYGVSGTIVSSSK